MASALPSANAPVVSQVNNWSIGTIMAMYQVNWHNHTRQEPRSSYWYVLAGKVTYASGLLKDWEGGDHIALVHHLRRKGLIIQWIGSACVPPTQKFHKELLSNVDALLHLLNEPRR